MSRRWRCLLLLFTLIVIITLYEKFIIQHTGGTTSITGLATRGTTRHHVNTEDIASVKTSPSIQEIKYSTSIHIHPLYNISHIFYNRVPKCGSTAILRLMQRLKKTNHYTSISSHIFMQFTITISMQRVLAEYVNYVKSPAVFNRHIHFINFTRFGMRPPVYINVIRDPIERLVSWFYFRRFQRGHEREMSDEKRNMDSIILILQTYDECVIKEDPECTQPQGNHPEEGYFKIIPFFCGQHPHCLYPTREALEQAKANVVKHYIVVGLQEALSQTVFVLERLLPEYFKNASREFLTMELKKGKRNPTHYRPLISEAARNLMKPRLTLEYEFYHFVKQRFHHQLSIIQSQDFNHQNHSGIYKGQRSS